MKLNILFITALVFLVLPAALAQQQLVRGTIYTQQGVPLDSVEVRAFSDFYVETPAADTTTEDGRYTITAAVVATPLEAGSVGHRFDIIESYPNPFGGTARLCAMIPKEGNIEATVTDILGRRVVVKSYAAVSGRNCIDFTTEHLASGLYTFVLRLGDEIRSTTMTHVPEGINLRGGVGTNGTHQGSARSANRGDGCVEVTMEASRLGFTGLSERLCLPLDATEVDFALSYATNELAATVLSASGGQVEGASISIDVDGDGIAEAETITDSEGTAVLTLPYHGFATLHVEKSGYASLVQSIFFSEGSVTVLMERLLLATPATAPITTPTYDGSGQSTHPDVQDMAWELAERGVAGTTWPTGGGGYRYWMWHTPYPFNDSNLENPSLLVSSTGDDGTWAVPTGATDPIFAEPETGYFADSDALLSPDADTMYVFWKHQQYPAHPSNYVIGSWSLDGVAWADTTHLIKSAGTVDDPHYASPAVVYNNELGRYEMYGTAVSSSADIWRVERYTATDPLAPAGTPGGWTGPEVLTFSGITPRVGGEIWHLDVRRGDGLSGSEVYRMALTLREYDNEDMWWCESADGLSWECEVLLVFDPAIAWTADGFYRPSFIPIGTPGSALTGYRMWYGGISEANEWRIGETLWTLE